MQQNDLIKKTQGALRELSFHNSLWEICMGRGWGSSSGDIQLGSWEFFILPFSYILTGSYTIRMQ